MAKQKTNLASFGAKALGLLAFAFMLYGIWHTVLSSNWWMPNNPSVSEIMLAMLWGVAGAITVSLSLMTVASLRVAANKDTVAWTRQGSTFAAIMLFAVSAAIRNTGWMWATLVGYVLLLLGAAMDSM